MTKAAIRVFPADETDWVVQEEGGRELGHYPTKASAETVGRTVARKRRTKVLVQGLSGEVTSKDFGGLFRRVFGG